MRVDPAKVAQHALALAAWFAPFVTASALTLAPWRRERPLRSWFVVGWWIVVASVAFGLLALIGTDPSAVRGRKVYVAANFVLLGLAALGRVRSTDALRWAAHVVIAMAAIGALVHVASGFERSIAPIGTALVRTPGGGALSAHRIVELSEATLAPLATEERGGAIDRAVLGSDAIATVRRDGLAVWPTAPNVALRATWSDGAPLAGRTFRFRIVFDSGDEVDPQRCRGIRFVWRGPDGAAATCEPSAWTVGRNVLQRSVTIPDGVAATDLGIEWFDLGGLALRLQDVTVEEGRGGAWTDVTTRLHGPAIEWRTVSTARYGPLTTRTLQAALPPDVPDARALDGAPRNPGSFGFGPWPRWSGWSTHPNAMAHLLVVAVAVSLALSRSTAIAWLVATVSMIGVATTGSRSGLVAVTLAVLVYAIRTSRGWRRWSASAIVIALGSIMAATSDRLRTLLAGAGPTENALTRLEIAAAAWRSTLASPWTGAPLTPESFFAPGDAAAAVLMPQHAHNVWLEVGSQFGMAALVALVVWTFGLGWWTVRREPWRRIGLVLPVVLVAAVDTTMLDLRTTLPFALALMALGGPPTDADRALQSDGADAFIALPARTTTDATP